MVFFQSDIHSSCGPQASPAGSSPEVDGPRTVPFRSAVRSTPPARRPPGHHSFPSNRRRDPDSSTSAPNGTETTTCGLWPARPSDPPSSARPGVRLLAPGTRNADHRQRTPALGRIPAGVDLHRTRAPGARLATSSISEARSRLDHTCTSHDELADLVRLQAADEVQLGAGPRSPLASRGPPGRSSPRRRATGTNRFLDRPPANPLVTATTRTRGRTDGRRRRSDGDVGQRLAHGVRPNGRLTVAASYQPTIA